MQKQSPNQAGETQSLDQYISKLMTDDAALQSFIADPTNGGTEYGITKAERAVLRRVIAHLSNNSKNGYGIVRQLDSYRRSLRLLQNVLHKHSANHVAQVASAEDNTYHIRVYVTGDIKTPGAPYTNPALAYQNYVTYTVQGDYQTLGEAMQFPNPSPSKEKGKEYTVKLNKSVKDKNNVSGMLESYTAICLTDPVSNTLEWYVFAFTLSGFDDSEFPNMNGAYILPYMDVKERDPFWYFSLDGTAISPDSKQGYHVNPDAVQGENAQSFVDFPLNGSTAIDWQPIAPDKDYGYGSCLLTDVNQLAS
ncbi:MAG: hypothetical protein AAFR59_02185 [Bacteroidota bacterium]